MRRITNEDLKVIDNINGNFSSRTEALEKIANAVGGQLTSFGYGAGKVIKMCKGESISIRYSKGTVTELFEECTEGSIRYLLHDNKFASKTWTELAAEGYTLGEANEYMKAHMA